MKRQEHLAEVEEAAIRVFGLVLRRPIEIAAEIVHQVEYWQAKYVLTLGC
jgi:hypothetical protein